MDRHRWSDSLTEPLAQRLEAAVAESAGYAPEPTASAAVWDVDGANMTTALRRASHRSGPAMKCAACDTLTPLQHAIGPSGGRSLLCLGCGVELLSRRSDDGHRRLSDD